MVVGEDEHALYRISRANTQIRTTNSIEETKQGRSIHAKGIFVVGHEPLQYVMSWCCKVLDIPSW
jgi:hypothetical protein